MARERAADDFFLGYFVGWEEVGGIVRIKMGILNGA